MTRNAIATRERIFAAAITLFSRYGFSRTSMEDIASEAALSRAALYLQFRNKEDIFRELARELQEKAMAQAAAALSARQPLEDRLRAAVEARMLPLIEIAYASPHGAELMDEKNRLCGDLWAENERRFREMLTRVFKRAAQTREIDLTAADLSAVEAVELFERAVSGLKGPGVTGDTYKRWLAPLVRVFIAGLQRVSPRRTAIRPQTSKFQR